MTDIVSAPSTDTPDHLAHVADAPKAADVHRAGEAKHTVRKILGLALRDPAVPGLRPTPAVHGRLEPQAGQSDLLRPRLHCGLFAGG